MHFGLSCFIMPNMPFFFLPSQLQDVKKRKKKLNSKGFVHFLSLSKSSVSLLLNPRLIHLNSYKCQSRESNDNNDSLFNEDIKALRKAYILIGTNPKILASSFVATTTSDFASNPTLKVSMISSWFATFKSGSRFCSRMCRPFSH